MSQISDEPVISGWAGAIPADIPSSIQAVHSGESVASHSLQSGLPLKWSESGPIAPVPSLRRTLSLGVKRAMDIVLSLGALIFFAPFLLAVAIAVKLTTRGSVLFTQDRVGLGGRHFRTYKFRTMHADLSDPTGRQQTVRNDARVSSTGRFLRRYSIDELPQLLNVLRGDMSIIGPRPHVAGMLAAGVAYEELVPYYNMRHLMKPGLSGWAQANGYRGPTENALSARARVNHDIAYIQNFSPALDARIILMTLQSEFFSGNGL